MDNIFLLAGDSYLINKNLRKIRESLNIQLEELNVLSYREMPSVDDLISACSDVPLMSDKRLVILKDTSLLAPKSNADEGAKLSEYLDRLPSTTVLIMCYNGAADKRRTLYKKIKKIGKVLEYPEPKEAECISFAMLEAKNSGVILKNPAAAQLVRIVGCDYYVIENEIAKLCIYTDGKEINSNHIKQSVSKSLEYNVFEMHSLLVAGKVDEAFLLLKDILYDGRPEALIGLIAYNFREMYKVRAMLDSSYPLSKITSVLKSRDFIIRKRVNECKRFSGEDLRRGITELGELDYSIKSGKSAAELILPQTLLKIYKL